MELVSNNEGPMYRIVTVFCDDRHRWLYTPFADLEDVGIAPYSFSAFSRIDEKGMYLEEEMDAQIFAEAYERKTGFKLVFNEVYEEPSPVRQKQNNRIPAIKETWEKRKAAERFRVVSGPRDTVDVHKERGE